MPDIPKDGGILAYQKMREKNRSNASSGVAKVYAGSAI